jgi:uncharacterized protein YkwD
MIGVTPWIALLAVGSPNPEQRLVESLVELTNEVRAQYQKGRLEWDEPAARIARRHAIDMVERNYFDHVAPDGTTLGDRVAAGGLTVFRAVGENLGMGSRDPRTMMRLWMESGGHRRNILDQRFTHVGIGYVPGSRESRSVWCVVFVSR